MEEIRVDQLPKENNWKYVTMYKDSLDEDMLYYDIQYNGSDFLEISYNTENGETKTENIKIKESAIKDGRKLYKLKYKDGYRPPATTDNLLISNGTMKGSEYKIKSIKKWPVYTQVKLHGIGMLCQDTYSNKLLMRSRLNNDFKHLFHIERELKEFFEYLPKNAILDGELYNHNMPFSTIVSIIKTVNVIHPRMNEIIYWIFDINYYDEKGTTLEQRYELLVNAYNRYVEDRSYPKTFSIVPTNIATNHETIVMQHDGYVNMGYEGLMVKHISNNSAYDSKEYKKSLYIPGRRTNILKYKNFCDEEAIIVSIENGKLRVKDIRNQVFILETREYIEVNNNLIGKNITFRYQELVNNIPKGPIAIAIRDYE
jgi:hypothetical protein